MNDTYNVTFGAMLTMSALWFLLGLIIAGIVTYEVMKTLEHRRLSDLGREWDEAYKQNDNYWREFVDGMTETSLYIIQEDEAREVHRDEYEIWLAEHGMRLAHDFDPEQYFDKWLERR